MISIAMSEKRDKLVEEECVYVQFSGIIDPQLLRDNYANMKFFGLDTNEPLLQIGGNTFFRGQYEHVLGTDVMFEEKDKTKASCSLANTSTNSGSNSDNAGKGLHYIGKTNKTLVMKRVFLEPKQQQDFADNSRDTSEDN